MEQLNTNSGAKKWRGFSSYQIKIIALIAMTVDHLAAYGFEIPIFSEYKMFLRIVGRIAAPLFLFVLTESISHTRNKKKFLLRLYLGAVWVGLFVTITNMLFESSVGRFSQSNILYTFFYVALYSVLLEQILKALKNREWQRGILSVLGIVATCIPHYLNILFDKIPFMEYGLDFRQVMIVYDFKETFIKSPLYVEYQIVFVIMGVLMYLVKNKYAKAAVVVLFSVIMGSLQYFMILALPIMIFYSGEKGKGQKYFFYIYYPLHRYVISIVVYIFRMLS